MFKSLTGVEYEMLILAMDDVVCHRCKEVIKSRTPMFYDRGYYRHEMCQDEYDESVKENKIRMRNRQIRDQILEVRQQQTEKIK
jgi:hypothetical protein